MTNEKDLPNDEPLEMVAVAGPAEAQMIEEMLKNNGIDSTTNETTKRHFIGCVPPVPPSSPYGDARPCRSVADAFPVARA